MPNKRIRKKYQAYYGGITEETHQTLISHKICKRLKAMFSKRNTNHKLTILHHDDLQNVDDIFKNHEPNGKYHSEDCNYNNPNNQIYHQNKHPQLVKQTKTWHFHILKNK